MNKILAFDLNFQACGREKKVFDVRITNSTTAWANAIVTFLIENSTLSYRFNYCKKTLIVFQLLCVIILMKPFQFFFIVVCLNLGQLYLIRNRIYVFKCGAAKIYIQD
jgi:hypothetical protein